MLKNINKDIETIAKCKDCTFISQGEVSNALAEKHWLEKNHTVDVSYTESFSLYKIVGR
jgi:hypothetical protein